MSEVTGRPRLLSVSSTRHEVNDALIAVRDAGVGFQGVPPEQLFEAFYTTKARGMGIGLAVSRTIILAHGGLLWAAPNAPIGAVFQFTLPGAGQ
jgi:signal transduction histidine kinase